MAVGVSRPNNGTAVTEDILSPVVPGVGCTETILSPLAVKAEGRKLPRVARGAEGNCRRRRREITFNVTFF